MRRCVIDNTTISTFDILQTEIVSCVKRGKPTVVERAVFGRCASLMQDSGRTLTMTSSCLVYTSSYST